MRLWATAHRHHSEGSILVEEISAAAAAFSHFKLGFEDEPNTEMSWPFPQ